MDEEDIANTIMIKLFDSETIGHAYIPIERLMKKFRPEIRGEVKKVIKKLVRKNYLLAWKSGKCISLNNEMLKEIRGEIRNAIMQKNI